MTPKLLSSLKYFGKLTINRIGKPTEYWVWDEKKGEAVKVDKKRSYERQAKIMDRKQDI